MKLEKKLDIRGPLDQAERCLDVWLKEENRTLTKLQRRRVVALMARYFHYEDDVTDELMLSFLRHYSGRGTVDMEDPASVRLEIKAVLDRAEERKPLWLKEGWAVASVLTALLLLGWGFMHQKISREQQAELKALVHTVDVLDTEKTSAAIWKTVKAPMKVRRYEDMTWWDYRRSRALLEENLKRLQEK